MCILVFNYVIYIYPSINSFLVEKRKDSIHISNHDRDVAIIATSCYVPVV